MGEYNYSAPYRGTGAPLPEGYLNALMQPGRNIGAGLESAGNAIAEGIGKYYKNKEERAGAQSLAEGAVAQYLQSESPVPADQTVSDSNPKDRYFAQLQNNQKNIINVVGEKTFNRFQEGKASASEMLGLAHSLNVYDTKKKEQQAVYFQQQQLNLNKASLAASVESSKAQTANANRAMTLSENSAEVALKDANLSLQVREQNKDGLDAAKSIYGDALGTHLEKLVAVSKSRALTFEQFKDINGQIEQERLRTIQLNAINASTAYGINVKNAWDSTVNLLPVERINTVLKLGVLNQEDTVKAIKEVKDIINELEVKFKEGKLFYRRGNDWYPVIDKTTNVLNLGDSTPVTITPGTPAGTPATGTSATGTKTYIYNPTTRDYDPAGF